jgi:plasmid stabilization system protein ParE
MSKRFRFHPDARADFREAIKWYRERSPAVALEFRVGISDAIRDVLRASHRWPKYLYGTRRFLLHRFPFSIVYLEDRDVVTIIAFAHGKRRPGYWSQRI